MTLIDGVNGPAAVAVAMWCGVNRPRSSGVDQRRRLQRTSAPSHILSGQRRYTDERLGPEIPVGATSRSGVQRLKPCEELQSSRVGHNLGNPCAEKVWPHRPRQNKGAAPLTKAPSAFRRIGGAVRQGTLTITGSNVRLGTEMPVALSSF